MTDTELLEVIRYNMMQDEFEFCACGGFHYVGKGNYDALRCLDCGYLFCNGMTKISNDADDYILEYHEELSKRCLFIVCGYENCPNRYCKPCNEHNITPMSGCEKCGAVWCCLDHMTCKC